MVKTISFLFLALILFTGNAKAAFMTNVDEGSFEFRLDIKHVGSYVNYSKLDLFFQDFARLNEAIVFDDITINNIGQMFVLTESDGNFSASTAFLTNGLPDWIIVSLTTPTRISYIEGTEPAALFGDPSGSGGIDLAGWPIESITLAVTDLVFIHGFDPSQGAYTNITVQGEVAIEYGGPPPLDADFSAFPTRGVVPLIVNFTDQSTGTVDSWDWSFGDGLSSNEQNPSHTYNDSGSYTVTLTVTSPDKSETETKTNYIRVSYAAKAMPCIPILLLEE
jgi:PKD repeat protein